MLVAEDLRFAKWFKDRPLIYPILCKAVAFSILFLVFDVVEEVLVGVFKGKTIGESVPTIGGGTPSEVFFVGIILAVALIPFFAKVVCLRGTEGANPAPSNGSGVGTGYDNFIWGHCGDVILEDVDPSTVRGNPVFQCCFYENNNDPSGETSAILGGLSGHVIFVQMPG